MIGLFLLNIIGMQYLLANLNANNALKKYEAKNKPINILFAKTEVFE